MDPRSAANASFDRTTLPGLFSVVDRLEKAIPLPPHFSESLLKEDDWSFIIKLHALLEASLTMLLAEKLGGAAATPRLREVLSHTEISAQHTGKVALASALGILPDNERRFIKRRSWLRNDMVHRIEHVAVTLRDYLARLDHNQRRSFASDIVSLSGPFKAKFGTAATTEILTNPKRSLWVVGFFILSNIRLRIDALQIERGFSERDISDVLDELRQVTADIEQMVNWLNQLIRAVESSPPSHTPFDA
jgi:hypothetical protein